MVRLIQFTLFAGPSSTWQVIMEIKALIYIACDSNLEIGLHFHSTYYDDIENKKKNK